MFSFLARRTSHRHAQAAPADAVPFVSTLGGAGDGASTISRMPIEQVRRSMLDALAGCHGPDGDSLSARIKAAADVPGLWALRNDLHACIARHFSPAEAQRRVNGLLVAFEGWLPSRRLSAV